MEVTTRGALRERRTGRGAAGEEPLRGLPDHGRAPRRRRSRSTHPMTTRSAGTICAGASTRSPAGLPGSASARATRSRSCSTTAPSSSPATSARSRSARSRSRSTRPPRRSRSPTRSATPAPRWRIVETAFLEQFQAARKDLPRARAPDRGRRRRRHRDPGGDRVRGSRLRRGVGGRRGRARRPADPDLHLGHDRAPEGRAAHPPQPDGADHQRRGHHRDPRARRQDHLLAARRPHRRARRPLLPAGDQRALGAHLPRPAQDRRVPARR